DLPEAYASYLVPLGNGLTVKAGKWATLIGYEVYESPKNLNFSRAFLYTLGTPYTHTGLLLTYPVTPWFSISAGFTNGWDNADNNNGYLRPIGSFAFTPSDKLSATISYLFGPEQNRDQMRGDRINNRWIVDTTVLYTGIDRVSLAVNFDFAGEENDPALVAVGRQNANSSWGGIAGYVGYDWTKALRTVLRLEYFYDPQGVRSSETVPAGKNVDLFEVTATAEYKIWRGLVGRLEFRHDEAQRKAVSLQGNPPVPTSRAQGPITVALYSSVFLPCFDRRSSRSMAPPTVIARRRLRSSGRNAGTRACSVLASSTRRRSTDQNPFRWERLPINGPATRPDCWTLIAAFLASSRTSN